MKNKITMFKRTIAFGMIMTLGGLDSYTAWHDTNDTRTLMSTCDVKTISYLCH